MLGKGAEYSREVRHTSRGPVLGCQRTGNKLVGGRKGQFTSSLCSRELSLQVVSNHNEMLKALIFYVCTCVCVCRHMHAVILLWRTEDNLRELVLSFHHADPGNWTQVFRLDSKGLCPLGHLISPPWKILSKNNQQLACFINLC